MEIQGDGVGEVEVVAGVPETVSLQCAFGLVLVPGDLWLYLYRVDVVGGRHLHRSADKGLDRILVSPVYPRTFGRVHQVSGDGQGVVEQELGRADRLAVPFEGES